MKNVRKVIQYVEKLNMVRFQEAYKLSSYCGVLSRALPHGVVCAPFLEFRDAASLGGPSLFSGCANTGRKRVSFLLRRYGGPASSNGNCLTQAKVGVRSNGVCLSQVRESFSLN